jgi:hypothetical protein
MMFESFIGHLKETLLSLDDIHIIEDGLADLCKGRKIYSARDVKSILIIHGHKFGLGDYVDLMKSLHFAESVDEDRTIWLTWDITISCFENSKVRKAAELLMSLFAFVEPDHIPFELLQGALEGDPTGLLLNQTVNELAKYSMINKQEVVSTSHSPIPTVFTTLSIHRLVQAVHLKQLQDCVDNFLVTRKLVFNLFCRNMPEEVFPDTLIASIDDYNHHSMISKSWDSWIAHAKKLLLGMYMDSAIADRLHTSSFDWEMMMIRRRLVMALTNLRFMTMMIL